MARGLRRRHSHEPEELNITAFMNLMVVLVPFLLLSAVFSQITILELNLPTLADAEAQENSDDKPKLVLEVIVRKESLDVIDRNRGRLELFPNTESGHDFAALNKKLRQVKEKFADETAITLLLEPDVEYDTLITTMDAVRSYQQGDDDAKSEQPLFPDISIGDAPKVRSKEERS